MTPLHAPVDFPANLSVETELFLVPAATAPGAASPRFAGEPVWWLKIPTGGQPLAMMTAARTVFAGLTGLPGSPAAASAIIELTPMPGSNTALLGRLLGGVPLQYVLLADADAATGPTPDVQIRADAGAVLMTATASPAWLGFVRQDRICRDPRAWVDDLEAAAGAMGVDASWSPFAAQVRTLVPPTIRLADYTGRPLVAGSFSIAVNAGPAQTITLSASSGGDTGVGLPAGTAQITSATNTANVILASATSNSGALGGPVTLTPTDRQVAVLALDSWLHERNAGVIGLERWTTRNTVTPILDGLAYFAELADDLAHATGGNVGLAGWAFVQDALYDPTKKWSLVPEDDSTEFVKLIKSLRDNHTNVTLLVNQFLQISDAAIDELQDDAAFLFIGILMLMMGISGLGKLLANPAVWVAVGALPLLVELTPNSDLLALLRPLAEPSKDAVDAINQNNAGTAFWTPYPATLADNPLAQNPLQLLGLDFDELTNIGVYHEKIALVQPPGSDPVAYLGGIDINSDRLDNPNHRAFAPFHDVQVRLTGPAVKDVVTSFAERATIAGATSAVTPPTTMPDDSARHVVQIGRTRFAPATTSDAGLPFPSAKQGENTTHETVLAAIRAAQDFIYIEEQYFTPDDEYVNALVDAGARLQPGTTLPQVKALVITLPDQTTQPFGAERRGEVVNKLATTWQDRLLVGAPIRRYLNPTPQTFAGLGRMVLRVAIDDVGETEAVFGPAERMPALPFWAFIESELVYVCEPIIGPKGVGPIGDQDPDDADSPTQTWQKVTIQRSPTGESAEWGAKPDKHDKNSAVLAVQLPGIYVHAKLMVIDDVFMSVGSSNLNRRGFEHDGETNVFAVSESLKRDPGNPAMRLRCQLWAEHFGLPTEMGLSLFADPISALSFFKRSWYRGSHWMPLQFESTTLPPAVVLSTPGSYLALFLAAIQDLVNVLDRKTLWATVVDPTTSLDRFVGPGDGGPDL